MQRLPTTASLHIGHGCSCSVVQNIPLGFLFKIKLLLSLLLNPVGVEKCAVQFLPLLIFQSFGAMIERFCDTLMYEQNLEITVDVVPNNEGSHIPDFAGLLLPG